MAVLRTQNLSTSSSAKIRNRSLKSEFIGFHSFHPDPVVFHQLPSCLQPGGAAGILPLFDPIGTDFVERLEFRLWPMRPVFDRGGHSD